MAILLDDSELQGSVLDIMGDSHIREELTKRKKNVASRHTVAVKKTARKPVAKSRLAVKASLKN